MLVMDRDTKYPRVGAASEALTAARHNSLEASNTIATLQAWSRGTDVYVHADEPSRPVLAVLAALPNVVAVEYQKPDVAHDRNNSAGDGMPRAVVQWWRLRAIWATLLATERRCHHWHRAVMRLRVDLRVLLPPAAPSLSATLLRLTTAAEAAGTVYMASDYAFAAERSAAQRIVGFYDRIAAGDYYHTDPARCHALDYRLLVDSDWEERGPCLLKYNWLHFPRAVFDALAVKSCKAVSHRMELLRDALRDALVLGNASRAPAHAYSTCGTCFPGNLQGMRGFESERHFLTYLLSSGLRIRRWPTRTHFGTLNDGCCCGNAGASSLPELSRGKMLD